LTLLCGAGVCAQEKISDSLKTNALTEVIVIGKKVQLYQKQGKPLMTVEDYLKQSGKIEMVKRGGYAWEPLINNMATERTVITIDGMRIFGACTDKMDPVTSYVEVSNLSEACVNSGAQCDSHGAAIGGSLDLKRNHGNLAFKGWNGALNTGFESNGSQRVLGTSINYSGNAFYSDADFMYRKSDNYVAGNHREVGFSKFGKFNVSETAGILFNNNKILEGSVIYDKATDVGYPALPMDVSLAEALITSLKFDYAPKATHLKEWETKVYFNTITHRMDDTKRPFVPIHMDMPGWSKTYGFYSKLNLQYGSHRLILDANSFYNAARAEMTMYPSDPGENLMFMETWPDVRTRYIGFFAEDNYALNCHSSIKIAGTIAQHLNTIESQMGLESLRIFFPQLNRENNRFLKNISCSYSADKNNFEYHAGAAFSERAPSVSEGYGFYLFNSFDRYDYIGNPGLKNERSIETNASAAFKSEKFTAKVAGSYFRISNYIIARPDATLIPMTIGANGVKKVTALDHANVANIECNVSYQLAANYKCMALVVYNYGADDQKQNLPFVSPLRYDFTLYYKLRKFSADVNFEGNLTQTQYSPAYGEDRTPAYAILNASLGHVFGSGKYVYNLRGGIENVFDTYYSTFSDWNNIPRKGRNFFVNFVFNYN